MKSNPMSDRCSFFTQEYHEYGCFETGRSGAGDYHVTLDGQGPDATTALFTEDEIEPDV
jgi:hypothetical protein